MKKTKGENKILAYALGAVGAVALLAAGIYSANAGAKLGGKVAASAVAAQAPKTPMAGKSGLMPTPKTTDISTPPAIRTLPPLISDGIINTVAGIGFAGFSGDDRLVATQSNLSKPCAVQVDSSAMINILDCGNKRVRRVYPNGNITTIAGNGLSDFFKTNIPAETFSFKTVSDMALDTAGNVYVADSGYNRIFKVDIERIMTVFAGNGKTEGRKDLVKAAASALPGLTAMAFDAEGNMYVSQSAQNIIRKIDKENTITTFAGTGVAGYSGDGGAATDAQLSAPGSLAVLPDGSLVVADTANGAIRKITEGKISTIFDKKKYIEFYIPPFGQSNTEYVFVGPEFYLMAGKLGNIYISDTANNRVLKLDTNGYISVVAGGVSAGFTGDGGKAVNALLSAPKGLCLDTENNLYIADSGNNTIRKIYFKKD